MGKPGKHEKGSRGRSRRARAGAASFHFGALTRSPSSDETAGAFDPFPGAGHSPPKTTGDAELEAGDARGVISCIAVKWLSARGTEVGRVLDLTRSGLRRSVARGRVILGGKPELLEHLLGSVL